MVIELYDDVIAMLSVEASDRDLFTVLKDEGMYACQCGHKEVDLTWFMLHMVVDHRELGKELMAAVRDFVRRSGA